MAKSINPKTNNPSLGNTKKRSRFKKQRLSTLLDQYSLKQAKHNDLGYDIGPLEC